MKHIPVLGDEVARRAQGRSRVVDATAGGGGHVELFVDLGAAVLAIDRDPDAVTSLEARFGGGVETCLGRFANPDVHHAIRRFHPDFILLDLGVSSHQLDATERGFTFRRGAPLDMRMDRSGATAGDLLNTLAQRTLRQMFREFGDEPRAARLAREIVARRSDRPFETSDDLVKAIRATLGPRCGPGEFARLFQAVRIAVNRELDELGDALPEMLEAIDRGGDLVVIAYHSGEDRAVKHTFRTWARACICPPRQPVCGCRGRPLGTVLTKKPVVPSEPEVRANPRARSARLRAFRKANGD